MLALLQFQLHCGAAGNICKLIIITEYHTLKHEDMLSNPHMPHNVFTPKNNSKAVSKNMVIRFSQNLRSLSPKKWKREKQTGNQSAGKQKQSLSLITDCHIYDPFGFKPSSPFPMMATKSSIMIRTVHHG